MSTAANHRKRSHRSERMTRSALGNFSRRARRYDVASQYGGPGIPLILRLQRMRQKIMAAKTKREEVSENGENR